MAWKHTQARPLNCPCAEADRLLSKRKVATCQCIMTYYIGNYDSITCEIVELECCPCGYEWCACQLHRGWGPPGVPQSPHTGPVTAKGGYLGFTTQLLFIKHESIVMFQNTENCWCLQCRKHCCYGNQSCIFFFVVVVVSVLKNNIYICALLLLDYCTFKKHCSAFYLRINSLISDWVGTKIMIIIIPDAFLVAFVNLLMVPAQ